MKIHKSQVTSAKPLAVEGEFSYVKDECKEHYPLIEVPSCHLRGLFENAGDILTFNYELKAKIIVSDSRTATPFEMEIEDEGIADVLPSYDTEGDGYVFEGTSFELEDLLLCLIVSNVPLAPHQEGSALPSSGKGYRVLTEEELLKEKEEEGNPAFAALDDYKID